MSSQKELTPSGAKVTTVVTSADAVVAAPAEPGGGEHGESTLGGALADNAEHAAAAIKNLSPTLPPEIGVTFYTEEALAGAAFVGHLMTDLDSVAGAIGGALLYGGVATCASEVNTETAFALDYWKLDRPPAVDSVLSSDPSTRICLVDHQQTSQIHPAVLAAPANIVGCIDHHALQNSTVVTALPIFVDIRPWGSMSSIIAHSFIMWRRELPIPVAGLLLCAILSDTLNLQSPTTTAWDRKMVAVLAAYTEIKNIDELASKQFAAKSASLSMLSAQDLVAGDLKSFKFPGGAVGVAVVETTDPDAIAARKAELIDELRATKLQRGLLCIFLAIVDIVKLKSTLLLCGPRERSLASAAFSDAKDLDSDAADLGSRVSRKKDYIPAITTTMNSGWECPAESDLTEHADTELHVEEVKGVATVRRRKSVQLTMDVAGLGAGVAALVT